MKIWAPVKGLLARKVVLILLAEVALLGASGLHSSSPDGNLRGYPWSYTTPVSPCYRLNPFNGCGSTLDLVGLSLDAAFWALISVSFVSAKELVFVKWRKSSA